MRWEKLGILFNPNHHQLSQGCSQFAKAPQALVFDDFVRIYFCSQVKDNNGKYRSIPHFVDFDLELTTLLAISNDPIISLGGLGEFDEHGIFPFNVLRHQDQIYAYSCGWSRRCSVSIDMAIGFAKADHCGNYFTKYGNGGPIMAATFDEPTLVGDPCVKYFNNHFHMWYIFGSLWKTQSSKQTPERNYRIAYAVSKDGINWTRSGKTIISTVRANEAQALPTVFKRGNRHHMYFCFRDSFDFRTNPNNAYRLGYAFSDDGITWQRADHDAGIEVSASGWDCDMQCYPSTFTCNGQIYMLYNGNNFGQNGFGLAKLVSQH